MSLKDIKYDVYKYMGVDLATSQPCPGCGTSRQINSRFVLQKCFFCGDTERAVDNAHLAQADPPTQEPPVS